MTDMIEELNKKGVRLKNYNVGPHKTTCPWCSHTRSKSKDLCLWVNITAPNLALWQCYNCYRTGYAGDVSKQRHEPLDKKREYKKPEKPTTTPDNDDVLKISKTEEFFKSRGITPDVVRKNKIYFEKNAICFPYYDRGELINVKHRSMDKKFWLEAGAKLILYGLDDIHETEATTLVIVEGEMDKLALQVCGVENVLSVPNGAVARRRDEEEPVSNEGQFEYFRHSEALLKRAKKVIIAVDDDPAGDNLRFELIRRIGAAKCWNVRFPEKDANGCLMAQGIDQTLYVLNDAQPVPIRGLYNVNDFTDSLVEYFERGMKAGVPTGWENVDHLYSVMPGEVAAVTGVPNSGKSEWVDALTLNLAKNEGWTFAVFSPEHGKEEHTTKLAEKMIGRSASPKTRAMSQEEYLNGCSWIAKHYHFIVSEDEDNLPTLEWVLEKATVAVMRYGIKGLVIDPWNELEHSRPNNKTESDFIGICIAKVMRWAKSHKVSTWLVAHPTKIHADKDGKMRVPSLYDIAGSANWVNKPDCGIVVYRSEDVSDTTEIHVKKIRKKFIGQRGMCTLRYDKLSGRYTTPASEENSVPKKGEGYGDMESY